MIGKYRNKVYLQSYAPGVQDTDGEPIRNWTTYATRTAAVYYLDGTETEVSKTIDAQQKYKIEMRYCPQLKQVHRLNYEGKSLNITQITHDPKHRETTVIATETVGQMIYYEQGKGGINV